MADTGSGPTPVPVTAGPNVTCGPVTTDSGHDVVILGPSPTNPGHVRAWTQDTGEATLPTGTLVTPVEDIMRVRELLHGVITYLTSQAREHQSTLDASEDRHRLVLDDIRQEMIDLYRAGYLSLKLVKSFLDRHRMDPCPLHYEVVFAVRCRCVLEEAELDHAEAARLVSECIASGLNDMDSLVEASESFTTDIISVDCLDR